MGACWSQTQKRSSELDACRHEAAAAGSSRRASETDVYNLMQDVRTLWMVLDVRSLDRFSAGHVDSACHCQPGTLAPDSLHHQVQQHFKDINVQSGAPVAFTMLICCDADSQPSLPEVCSLLGAAKLSDPFEMAQLWSFEYTTLHAAFPFLCTDFPVFEESRVYPSWIADRLFLSHWSLAADPFVVQTCLHATHVVNCTRELPCCFEDQGVTYHRVPVNDDQTADLLSLLREAVAFISAALAEGGVVLVHCKHGQSRSASVVAAHLMQQRGWDLAQSLAHLQQCRPRVSPNVGFRGQLQSFHDEMQKVV
mmetsp:Transcript_6448/g.14104  ORF Transcript_6448/g.14104 Transcript_6448/m.14104 type:complete len:309 (+) Transcript_6448:63-989(+)